ncbi:MAG: response regulator, partial [candidate division Zixibacteria bacterium]|nr:response regulator [candidate division Zixibacteria bacterium]
RNLDPALAKGFESLEAGEGVLKQVLSGEAYFADRSKADSDVFMKLLNQSGIESAVCIPLPARDSQIGALAILSHQKFRFSKEDQSLLEEATYYLGEKIEFLRVAREIRRKSEGLNQAIAENRILANLSGRLASESRLEVLLDRILWEGLKVIEAKTGHIFVLEGESLEAKASLEPATSGSKGNIAEYPLAKRMFSGKTPLSEKGNLLVPVMLEGIPAGLLWYEKVEPEQSFSRAEIERAQVLANQAALAMGKWKLLELVEKLRQSNQELSEKLSRVENRLTVTGAEAELLHPSITNDLNNHLAAVLGNLELIQKQIQFNSTPEMQAFSGNLREVETAALQAAELLRTVDQPKVFVPAVGETHAGNNRKPASVRALRILSIDDQKMILDLLESMLATLGHETEVASNGIDGLEKFRQNSFDVVITDLGMPDISGFEIASQVKKIKPDMPVILITGWGSNFDEAQLKQAGVDYLLAKPFRLEQLQEVIGKITNP